MRVALISRSSLFKVKGGDTIQIIKTSEELNKLGINASVKLANDDIDYGAYDLLHFFNLIRPADHIYHIRKSKKPFVLSSIYLDYSAFDTHARTAVQQWVFKSIGKMGAEYLKNMYRYARGQEKLVSYHYLLGHKKAMLEVVKKASLLLPNSESEYTRLSRDLGIKKQYLIIPNGIDKAIFGRIPKHIKRKDEVICVGQIYGMKNQHRLIEACLKLGVPLKLIGKPPPNHTAYYTYCKEISGPLVQFIDFVRQEELPAYYAGAKVHALPSWFETTGLSSLEAGAMDCNLVVGSGGDTGDYFRDIAWFCNAGDKKSILQAIQKAMSSPSNHIARDKILENYTWENAARKTLLAYQTVLNNG